MKEQYVVPSENTGRPIMMVAVKSVSLGGWRLYKILVWDWGDAAATASKCRVSITAASFSKQDSRGTGRRSGRRG